MDAKNTIAFFDFDGTLIKPDSLFLFLKYYFPLSLLIKKTILYIPSLVRYKLGIISNSQAKEILFIKFFKGESESIFKKKSEQFATEMLQALLKKEGIEKLKYHLQKNHEVVVVSASISDYLNPLFEHYKIRVISTELEKSNHTISGKFSTPNCYGPEKVNRIKAIYNLEKFNEIFAYGDSTGDRELLKLASQPFYRKFN